MDVDPESRTPSSQRVLLNIFILTTGIRVALWVIGTISVAKSNGDPWTLDWWSRWDAPHLMRVAEIGYGTQGEDALFIVFLPAYPLAVAIVRIVIRSFIGAGLLISYASSIAAAWFLYRYARLGAEHEEAWRAVLLLLAFPTAYFLAVPYSESLFLLAVMASLYLARTHHWGRAVAMGAIATATRLQALPLLAGLVVRSLELKTWKRRITALAFTGMALVGFTAYLLINWRVHGDPLHFMSVQSSHWYNHAALPWVPLVDAYRAISSGVTGDLTFIMWGRVVTTPLVAAILVLGIRRLDVADSAYGWLAFLAILISSWLISMPRYVLGIYPLFLVGAWHTKSRRVLASALVACSALQVFFFWRYARGAWTF